MPNIIEQQDLLKGLPDDRLSMLMQNPTGDIPPFLVAAEAQRRQSIREQFSGGPQESVVDTLTKQLANVPQNIQSQGGEPPQMPPQQPEMGGVAGLDQGMRDGGYVQRYDVGGQVEPWWTLPDYSGAIPKVMDYVGSGISDLYDFATTPYSEMKQSRDEEADSTEFALPDIKIVPGRFADSLNPPPQKQVETASPANIPPDPNAGKQGTSSENKGISLEEYKRQLETIYGVKAEDSEFIRKKLQELYGDNEPSDWEKAQKWFAAAKAAVEPGQTNTQAIVNALSSLGGGFAQERASERENRQAMAEALLKLDISDRDQRRQAEQEIAKGSLEYLMRQQDAAASAAASNLDYERDLGKIRLENELIGKRELEKAKAFNPTSAVTAYQKLIQEEKDIIDSVNSTPEQKIQAQARIEQYSGVISNIMSASGYATSSGPTMAEMRAILGQ